MRIYWFCSPLSSRSSPEPCVGHSMSSRCLWYFDSVSVIHPGGGLCPLNCFVQFTQPQPCGSPSSFELAPSLSPPTVIPPPSSGSEQKSQADSLASGLCRSEDEGWSAPRRVIT